MAENESGQEKKHEPTERKWVEAAEKGELPKSKDIGSAVVVVVGAAVLVFGGGVVGEPLLGLMGEMMSLGGPEELDLAGAEVLGGMAMVAVATALALPMAAIGLAGIAAGVAQTQLQLAPKALEPDLNRLNPISGFKNLFFSSMPLIELAKGVTKLGILGLFAWLAIRHQLEELPMLAAMGVRPLLLAMAELGWRVVAFSVPVLIGVAAIDYGYSYWRAWDGMKLTDQEQKEEMKSQEGDPLLRALRRNRARQIASRGAIQAVQQADVVVTNPTHYAVALRYKQGEDAAPVVLAKGVDALALRMRQEALRHDVPRVEDRPLARALYARVQEGQPVPEDLYVAVAKVLAWVWRGRSARR